MPDEQGGRPANPGQQGRDRAGQGGGQGLDKPIVLVNAAGETRESTNREWRDNGAALRAEGWTRPEDEEEEQEEGEGEE
jgi:hypothetical protein